MNNWITDFNDRVRTSNAPPQNRRYQQNGPSPGGPRPFYPQHFGGADWRQQNCYQNQQNSYGNYPNSNAEEVYDVKPLIGPGNQWQTNQHSGPSPFMHQQSIQNPYQQADTRNFYGPPPPIYPSPGNHPSGNHPNHFQPPQYSSNYNSDHRSQQNYFRPNNVRRRPSHNNTASPFKRRSSNEHHNKNNRKSPVVQNRNLTETNNQSDLGDSFEQTACVISVPDNSVQQSPATDDSQSKPASTLCFDSRPMSSISVSTSSLTLPSTPRSCSVSAKEIIDIKTEPNEDDLILLKDSGESSDNVIEDQILSSNNKTSTSSSLEQQNDNGEQSNQNLLDDDDLDLLLNSPVRSEQQNKDDVELNEDDLLNSPINLEQQNEDQLIQEFNEDDLLNSPINLEQQDGNEAQQEISTANNQQNDKDGTTANNQQNNYDHSIQYPTSQNLDNIELLDSPPCLQREESIEITNDSDAISSLQVLTQNAPNLVSNVNSVLNQSTPAPRSAVSNQVLTPVPIQTMSLVNSMSQVPLLNCGIPLNVKRIQGPYAFLNSFIPAGTPVVFVPVPVPCVPLASNPVQVVTTPTKSTQVRVTYKQSPIWKLQVNGCKLFTKLSANEAQCNGCIDPSTNDCLKFRISGNVNSLHTHISKCHPNFVKQLNLLNAQTVTELENTMNQHVPPQFNRSNAATSIQQSAPSSSSNHCSAPVSSNVDLTPTVREVAETPVITSSSSLSIADILSKSASPLRSSNDDTQLLETCQSPPISVNDLTWSTTMEASARARQQTSQPVESDGGDGNTAEDLNQQDAPALSPVPENPPNTDVSLDANLDDILGIGEQNNPDKSSQDRIPSASLTKEKQAASNSTASTSSVLLCKDCKEKPVYRNKRCKTCYSRVNCRQNREYHQLHENMYVSECLQANSGPRKRRQPLNFTTEMQLQDQHEQERRKRIRLEKDNGADIQHSNQPIIINGVQIKEEPMDESEYNESSYTIPSSIVARMEASTDMPMETTQTNKCLECEILIEDEVVSESPNHCLDCFKKLNYCICSKCKEVKRHKAKGKCAKCYQQDKYGKPTNVNEDAPQTPQTISLQPLDKPSDNVCVDCKKEKQIRGFGRCTICYYVYKSAEREDDLEVEMNESDEHSSDYEPEFLQQKQPDEHSSDESEGEVDASNQLNLTEPADQLNLTEPADQFLSNGPGIACNYTPNGWKRGQCKWCRCKLNEQNRSSYSECVNYCAECFETKVNQRDCNKCKQRKRHYGKGLCRDCYYNKTKISQPASNTVLNEENNAQEDVPESQPTPWQLPVFFGPKAAADYTPKNWKKGQCKVCNCKLANVARLPKTTKCTNYYLECFETRINQCICVDCKLQKRHNSKDRCYECFKTFMRLTRRRSGNTTMELSTNHSIATNDQELEDDDIIHIPGPSHRAPLKRPSTRSQRVQPDNQASTQRQVPAVQPQRPQVVREGAIINAMARTVQINNIEYIELSSGEESDY